MRRSHILCSAVASCLLVGSCSRIDPATPPAEAAIEVRVGPVIRISEPRWRAVAGTVRPAERAVVTARIAGSIAGAEFGLGQVVAANELVLTIEAAELSARVDQATAAFDQAAREAAREARLLAEGASTGETSRSAEDRLRAARAALTEARTLADYRQVRAPFAGTITRKFVDSGDVISVGARLYEIHGLDRMQADLEIPEDLRALSLGTAVRVQLSTTTVDARVVESSAALDPLGRTRPVVVEFPPATSVSAGEFVRALWPEAEQDVVLVPAEAVVASGQIERVFVVENGRALLRVVRTGSANQFGRQVLAGVNPDEQVILAPPSGLRDGQSVQVSR